LLLTLGVLLVTHAIAMLAAHELRKKYEEACDRFSPAKGNGIYVGTNLNNRPLYIMVDNSTMSSLLVLGHHQTHVRMSLAI
jgi:hypothetical protein